MTDATSITPHPSDRHDGVSLLTRVLLAEETLGSILDRIVAAAHERIPGVTSASVSLLVEGGYDTPTATTGDAIDLDIAQYQAKSGPCVEAIDGAFHNIALLPAEADRWPEFVAAAEKAGIKSSMSLSFAVPSRPVGALNLYSHEAGAFDDDAVELARSFADEAAVLLANAESYAQSAAQVEQLQTALQTREMIGQAKGIIMMRERCSPDEAFDILRRASQHSNRKLRELAQEVVDQAQRR